MYSRISKISIFNSIIFKFNIFYFNIDIKQCWNVCISGSYPILICTDDILSDIDITNVTWLIHYSIPLHSKTQFNFRFSTLIENLQMVQLFYINNFLQFFNLIQNNFIQ